MPKSKKSDLTGVVMWAVIIALVAGMFWVAGFETLEKWRHPAQNGVPNVFQEDREYWSRVNSPIVAGNRLYLLFDALQLVKVYDLQGNYLYTVNMTNKNHHGISALYAKDDEMYFREQSELYCFKADQFVQREFQSDFFIETAQFSVFVDPHDRLDMQHFPDRCEAWRYSAAFL